MKMEVASMISTAFGDGRLSRTRGSRKLTGFRTALWVVEHTVLTTVGRRGLGEPRPVKKWGVCKLWKRLQETRLCKSRTAHRDVRKQVRDKSVSGSTFQSWTYLHAFLMVPLYAHRPPHATRRNQIGMDAFIEFHKRYLRVYQPSIRPPTQPWEIPRSLGIC